MKVICLIVAIVVGYWLFFKTLNHRGRWWNW